MRSREPALANPTYRHILSPAAQNPANPLRVIAHCDIDAAYAQFEAVRLGIPDHLPVIVIQWETIIAVNYPARKYGIKRCSTMGPKEAKELCPHVNIVHTATYRPGELESGYWEDANVETHKVSLDPYRKESAKVLAVFKEMAPKAVIQKASIDEAYIDLTPLVLELLLQRHPFLAQIPPDAPLGIDSPLPPAPPINWSNAGCVIPSTSGLDTEGMDEHTDSEDGRDVDEVTSWTDWALCLGAEIMAEIRAEVWRQLHYTSSAGIAHNKAMAKLCSSYRKPNNQTVLRHAAVRSFLWNTPFTKIRNLGGKLGRAVSDEFKAETVGELLRVPLTTMQSRFGEESIWIFNLIRGIDDTEVTSFALNKTMMASKNLIPPCTTPQDGLHWIDLLAGELNVRLLEAQELSPGLWPMTLTLAWRTGYGYGNNMKSRQASFGFSKASSIEHISKAGRKLWEAACPGIVSARGGMDVHSLSLTFSGITRRENGQQDIKNFLSPGKRKRVSTPPIEAVSATNVQQPQPAATDDSKLYVRGSMTWSCSRCSRDISIPPDRTLDEIQQEHDDYHYALQLAEIPSTPSPSKKTVKGKDPGIAAFFTRKG